MHPMIMIPAARVLGRCQLLYSELQTAPHLLLFDYPLDTDPCIHVNLRCTSETPKVRKGTVEIHDLNDGLPP